MSSTPDLAVRRGLKRRLRRMQVEIWFERLQQEGARGLCLGLLLALAGALALGAGVNWLDQATLMALMLAGCGAGLLFGAMRPPTLLEAARVFDRRLALQARLGTAVELLPDRSVGRLDQAQLCDTVTALADLPGRLPPLRLAWREALLALGLSLAVLAALRPVGLVRLPSFGSPNAGMALGVVNADRQSPGDPIASGPAQPAAAGTSGQVSSALRTLDALAQARQSGTLDHLRENAVLDRLEADLNQQANDARRQQESLERLSRALAQVSAAASAAQSIQRADYARAGQQLKDLGRDVDQLSGDARSQLGQALRRAAAETPANPALADRERRAADALAGRDYQTARLALSTLGDEVGRSGGQQQSQSELADALQRLGQERDAAAGESPSADRNRASPGGSAAASAGAGGSQAGDGEGSGNGPGPVGVGSQAEGAGDSSRQSSPAVSGERAGDAPLGGPAPTLGMAGKPVEVLARPGNDPEHGAPAERPGAQEQPSNLSQASLDADQQASIAKSSAQAERVTVRGNQRQVVRDYFARLNARTNP